MAAFLKKVRASPYFPAPGPSSPLPPPSQIIWSKRRRSLFFGLTVLVFLIDVALVLKYSSELWPHTLPASYQSSFLGWNLLYNTQGPGSFSGDSEFVEKLWRSWWFYAQIGLSAYILSFRLYAIKIHEKDVGTCTRKDWKNFFLKVCPVVVCVSLTMTYDSPSSFLYPLVFR